MSKSINVVCYTFATRRIFICFGALLLLMFAATISWAGGGPENVFLLVNSASQDSMTVANHYIELRKIPPNNVYYIDYQKSKRKTTGEVFRNEILLPALSEMKRRKLSSQIDYLVYSCDFPWQIDFTSDFAGEKFPSQFKPIASLSGATYLASFVMQKRKELVGLNTNFYFSGANAAAATSQGFRSLYRWAPGGKRTVKNGLGYYLSSVLGVTDGRGNSVEEIVHSLKLSAAVDGTSPRGTIYYVKNNTPRSTPRHNGFESAIQRIRLAGGKAELVSGKTLTRKRDVMGLVCGAAQLKLNTSGCKFLPGAFCDNLTSYGGSFTHPKVPPGHTCVSEFLREGAAGACGAVIEPYNFPQKFPSAELNVHYLNGCSLAEAFYQSVQGPYQLILVGDPLCQPWAKAPAVSVSGIREGWRIRGQVEIIPSVKPSSSTTVRLFELYVDGVRIKLVRPGRKFLLDTKKLDDGQHELRVVAIANSPVASQGRWVGKVIVKNDLHAVQLSVDEKELAKGGEIVSVKVSSTSLKPVTVFHNGRELGRVEQGSGNLQIDARKLGSGPVTLYGLSEGDVDVRSYALKLVVPELAEVEEQKILQ